MTSLAPAAVFAADPIPSRATAPAKAVAEDATSAATIFPDLLGWLVQSETTAADPTTGADVDTPAAQVPRGPAGKAFLLRTPLQSLTQPESVAARAVGVNGAAPVVPCAVPGPVALAKSAGLIELPAYRAASTTAADIQSDPVLVSLAAPATLLPTLPQPAVPLESVVPPVWDTVQNAGAVQDLPGQATAVGESSSAPAANAAAAKTGQISPAPPLQPVFKKTANADTPAPSKPTDPRGASQEPQVFGQPTQRTANPGMRQVQMRDSRTQGLSRPTEREESGSTTIREQVPVGLADPALSAPPSVPSQSAASDLTVPVLQATSAPAPLQPARTPAISGQPADGATPLPSEPSIAGEEKPTEPLSYLQPRGGVRKDWNGSSKTGHAQRTAETTRTSHSDPPGGLDIRVPAPAPAPAPAPPPSSPDTKPLSVSFPPSPLSSEDTWSEVAPSNEHRRQPAPEPGGIEKEPRPTSAAPVSAPSKAAPVRSAQVAEAVDTALSQRTGVCESPSLAEQSSSYVDDGGERAMELAFQARLVPAKPEDPLPLATSPHSTTPGRPTAESLAGTPPAVRHAEPAVENVPGTGSGASQKQTTGQDGESAGAQRHPRKPESASADQLVGSSDPPIHAAAHPAMPALSTVAGETTRRSVQEPADAGLAVRTEKAAPEPATPVKVPVHDIQLHLNGAEGRVDIRVMERGGEVRVDVRTPDSRVSEALRGDLPALATRLEQSGFHAETWHPAPVAAAERERAVERSAATEGQPQQQQGRGDSRDQREDAREQPPKRDPHFSQPNQDRNQDRKDFSWLYTSLQ